MAQLGGKKKIAPAATKIRHNQMNKYLNIKKKKAF